MNYEEVLLKQRIKSSLYLRYYAETCNEWRGPFPRLSVWVIRGVTPRTAPKKRRSGGNPFGNSASDFIGLGIELQTYQADCVTFNHDWFKYVCSCVMMVVSYLTFHEIHP